MWRQGGLTFAALPFVAHATCTDFASGMVAAVRDKAQRLGVEHRVTAEVRDVTDLSAYGDSMFDAVFCMLGLFMLPSEEKRQQAVRETYRVVKAGGCVVVCNWSAWDRSQFHSLMLGCSARVRHAKREYATRTTAEPATAATLPAIHPPATYPSSEDEHRKLFSVVPFASVVTTTRTLAGRSYLTPLDFWYSTKSFTPLWDWADEEEERRVDEAAVVWLGSMVGNYGAISPNTTAILAMGRK